MARSLYGSDAVAIRKRKRQARRARRLRRALDARNAY